MADTLLAAMNFAGLMDNNFTDFFVPESRESPEVKVETISVLVPTAPAPSDQTKEDEISPTPLQHEEGYIKTRTIKLRNPDLAAKLSSNISPNPSQTQPMASRALLAEL